MVELQRFDAIIFDFGGVIINIDYHRTIESFQQLGISDFRSLYNQAEQDQLFDDVETGRISPQQFINKLLDHLPSGTSPNQVVAAWNAMILDVPAKRIQLLEELRNRDKKVFLLSNTNSIHIDKAWRNWDATETGIEPEQVFNKIYLSHEINLRKPNVEIFELVCNENELDPSRTLFIDDSVQHILGAQKLGLQTFHLVDTDICQLFS